MAVRIETSMGSLTVKLFYDKTPITCRNFLELAKSGYYDGCIFHRVVKGFMCQTGDPDPSSVSGTGGESIYGPTFKDEMVPSLSHDSPGIVSMANSGLNTNASQFFILFRESESLDGKHTVFGKVEESDWSVLQAIEQLKVGKNERPIKPVKIFGCHVEEDPWVGEALPPGAAIPEKALVNQPDKNCSVQ
eukprot:TRINITY_DN111043_c0_g1_i1.p1 TRINITY_DN111043_c0_g1~~TRINITY_DN111043_c0_g1_i1.p1  ORF type:complete len:214 (-),score=21.77 TRINITY_DN111043_c0_g1_i1:105-674(-)